MQQKEHPAVTAIKTRADRAADALTGFGYDVKRTHLMDVLARIDGERNWKEYKAKLSKSTVPTKSERTAYEAPNMGGKTIHLLVSAYIGADDEVYGYLKVDQKMVGYMADMMAEQILAISTEGTSAHMQGSVPIYWFAKYGGCVDVCNIDLTGFDLVMESQAKDAWWGNAVSQTMDLADIFSVIEAAVRTGSEYAMHVEDDQEAIDVIRIASTRDELKVWSELL